MYFRIALIILCAFTAACNNTEKERREIRKFERYHLWRSSLDSIDLRESSNFYILKAEAKSLISFKTFNSDNEEVLQPYFIKTDSIFFEDRLLGIFDTIQVSTNRERLKLFISDFDQINSADEESYLFWNKELGIVAQYNWSMGPILLFEPDGMEGLSDSLYRYIVMREKGKL